MILPGTRLLLLAFSGLTLLAFVVLFIRAGATDRYFAWTIQPPATAAFLGAAYAAGCALVVLALRTGTWSALRIPFVTIGVFTLVTLVATVLHLDRFHFGVPEPLPRLAAYVWLGVYVLVPPAMAVALVRQERRPFDHPERHPIQGGLATVLAVQGGLMLVVGLVLFVAPATAAVLWPWPLTPLTARMVAAWLFAFGLGVTLAWRHGDLARLSVPAWAYGLLAVLQLVVVARYAGLVRWAAPATWVYLGLLVSMLLSSAYALRRVRAERAAQVGVL